MIRRAKWGEARDTIDAAIGCDDTKTCIPWLFSTSHTGQPAACIDGKGISVRRYVYSKSRGLPDSSRDVTTTCGNRCCINPHHLKEETRPVVHRGVNAKLTDDDVRAIRELRRQGLSLSKIAKQFDCAPSTVSLIGSRKLRKQVV